jgi:hypothetical protein
MNPMSPKIAGAIKQIEAAYAGQESAHAYYGQAQKVYILVVSGDEAEAYHKAVMAPASAWSRPIVAALRARIRNVAWITLSLQYSVARPSG